MADLNDTLLAVRYAGISELPDTGDAGDRQVQQALEREMTGKRSRRPAWTTRRIRVGGFAVAPVAVLAVVATAAAATTAAVAISATSLFQQNPAGYPNGPPQTVLPSTVRQVDSVTIPDYGTVAAWGATTQQGGLCIALKLPDGTWAGLPGKALSDGQDGGEVPGCFKTRQQMVVNDEAIAPGQQPTGAAPMPLEAWDDTVVNSTGQHWDIYVGYVEAQGTAATVRSSVTGMSTPVTSDGYYMLAEPPLRQGQIPGMGPSKNSPQGGYNPNTLCSGCDVGNLQVLNAAGQQLQPDYTFGKLLPGYSWGPTSG
jgi:hypothetical protein